MKNGIKATPLSSLIWNNVIAQGIALVFIPIFSRIFLASTISGFGIILSSTYLLWSFSQLRMDIAQFKAENREERDKIFQAGIFTHAFFSLCACVLLFFADILRFEWLLLGWVSVIGFGVHHMAISWLSANYNYRLQHYLRLVSAVITYPGAILLYPITGEHSVIIALALGFTLPVGYLILIRSIPKPFSFGSNLHIVKKYWETSLFIPLGNLLVALADHGFILFIAASADAATSAAVFLAMRVCATPLSLIQAPLSQYHYRKFQDLHENRELHNGVYMDIWRRWLLPALLIFVPIVCFGPSIFTLILGEAWTFAGQTAAIIAPLYFVRFLNNPTSMGFYIIGKSAVFFYFTVVLALVLPLAYLLAAVGLSLPQLLMFYVTYLILVYMAYNLTMLTLTSQHTT